MKHNNHFPVVLFVVAREEAKTNEPNKAPHWLIFLAYLAYLRAMRPQSTPEVSALRMLIVITGLVLVTVALVVAGAPDKVGEVVHNWPILP